MHLPNDEWRLEVGTVPKLKHNFFSFNSLKRVLVEMIQICNSDYRYANPDPKETFMDPEEIFTDMENCLNAI
jgi:hypothetical protein